MHDNIPQNQYKNLLDIAERLIELQQYEEAKNILDRLLEDKPGNIEVLNDMAVVHILENDLETALNILKYVLISKPNNKIALNNLQYVKSLIDETLQNNIQNKHEIGIKNNGNFQNIESKICFIIVFNHRFDTNIEILEDIYKNRFENIYFIVPFYNGNRKDVITVYESSYNFSGYYAQALEKIYDDRYTHYVLLPTIKY